MLAAAAGESVVANLVAGGFAARGFDVAAVASDEDAAAAFVDVAAAAAVAGDVDVDDE